MEVELPDGTIAEFPDDTPPDVMRHAVQKYHLRQTTDQQVDAVARHAQQRGTMPTPDQAREAAFSQENRKKAEDMMREAERGRAANIALAGGAATLGGIAAAPYVVPLAARAALPIAGGYFGAGKGAAAGRKVAEFAGLPKGLGATVGGVLGGTIGAFLPGGAAKVIGNSIRVAAGLPIAGAEVAAPIAAAGAGAATGAAEAAAPAAAEVASPAVAEVGKNISRLALKDPAAFKELQELLGRKLAEGAAELAKRGAGVIP